MKQLFLMMILSALGLGQAMGCTCEEPQDDREGVTRALNRADLVFVGRIEYSDATTSDGHSPWRARFYILQSWKGENATRVYVQTDAACGFPFPAHGEYLVYAYGPDQDGYYKTSVCTRTRERAEGAGDIALLDEIQADAEARR